MYTDTADGWLVIATVQVVDGFGWTTFTAVVRRKTLRAVDTTPGELPDMTIRTMSQCRASRVLLQTFLPW